MDIGDRVPNIPCGEGFQVTSTSAGQNPGPMTRAVFKMVRVDKLDVFGSDEFIRFGQKVRIEANDYFYKKRISLSSYKHTSAICSESNR